MKYVLIVIIALFSLVSCDKTKEVTEEKEVVKIAPKKSEFGFVYADYNVVHDTIQRGDAFGTILESQNIGDRKIYDVIAAIKDTFNVRSIRFHKPFTLLRSKNKMHELQVFIYQPDALSYYVVDFRDLAVVAYK